MKQMAIRVTPALYKRLQKLAVHENNHISAVTRRLLSEQLEREQQVRIALERGVLNGRG
jgi:predicted transcriptional regulator